MYDIHESVDHFAKLYADFTDVLISFVFLQAGMLTYTGETVARCLVYDPRVNNFSVEVFICIKTVCIVNVFMKLIRLSCAYYSLLNH